MADDPGFRWACREAWTTLLIWVCATAYTALFCLARGYRREPESIAFVLGFPDWVFWGVLAPWLVCMVLTTAFALLMKEEELEPDRYDYGEGEPG